MPLIARDSAVQTVTIAISTSISTAVDGRRYAAYGLVLPALFTGTALTFTTCDNLLGTYQALYNTSGVLVTIAVVANSRNFDVPFELAPWPYWKIVSGSTETAARSIVVVAKG